MASTTTQQRDCRRNLRESAGKIVLANSSHGWPQSWHMAYMKEQVARSQRGAPPVPAPPEYGVDKGVAVFNLALVSESQRRS